MAIIDYSNFLDYLKKEVNIEICGRWAGFMYPERNNLIAMTKHEYFFQSIEEDGTHQYWSFLVSEPDWSIEVYSINSPNTNN